MTPAEPPEEPTPVTPRVLAERLGVTQLIVRNHLRDLYGTLPAGTSRWLLDPEQEAAVVTRITTSKPRARANARAREGVRPRPWSAPQVSDIEVDLPADSASRVASRVEFELQADFGRWLEAQGTPPALLPLPVESGMVQPDLYVPDRDWLVEAKKSSDRQYVRMAIGQVLDYCHLAASAGIDAEPVILLPQRPTNDLVGLIHSLGITLIHRADATFTVAPPGEEEAHPRQPRSDDIHIWG